MKRIIIALASLSLVSCHGARVVQVGEVNMVSHRNIDSKTDYKLLRYYAGGGDRELQQTRSESLNEAIDAAVMAVPGGEFLKNARFYQVGKEFWAVSGDVWGMEVKTEDFNGFKIGEQVYYRPKKNRSRKATVVAMKNATTYLIELEQTGRKIEAAPGDLYKIGEAVTESK